MEEKVHKNKQSLKTRIFIVFMVLFFGLAGFMTYYSQIVYTRLLPRVGTVMPERTERDSNGRLLYLVPEDCVRVDNMNGRYLLTARYSLDVLGERYLAARIDIWVVEKGTDGMVLVDGIIQEEPIIAGTESGIEKGDAVTIE